MSTIPNFPLDGKYAAFITLHVQINADYMTAPHHAAKELKPDTTVKEILEWANSMHALGVSQITIGTLA